MPIVTVDGHPFDAVFPEECPRCHMGIVPVSLSGIKVPGSSHFPFQIPFKCPACKQLFIASYESSDQPPFKTEPQCPIESEFGLVDIISPQFVTIFNQASAAEAASLDEIAGLGYRKALEFLIKDFCITLSPEQSEVIKAEWLGTVIKNRIESSRLKSAAERVAWLGNDEAHYIRKWESHDLADLKSLLRLTTSFITEEMEYRRLMDSFTRVAADAQPPA